MTSAATSCKSRLSHFGLLACQRHHVGPKTTSPGHTPNVPSPGTTVSVQLYYHPSWPRVVPLTHLKREGCPSYTFTAFLLIHLDTSALCCAVQPPRFVIPCSRRSRVSHKLSAALPGLFFLTAANTTSIVSTIFLNKYKYLLGLTPIASIRIDSHRYLPDQVRAKQSTLGSSQESSVYRMCLNL